MAINMFRGSVHNDHKTLHHLPVQNTLSYPKSHSAEFIPLFDCVHFLSCIMILLSAGSGTDAGAGG
jgi:hypothetical protein